MTFPELQAIVASNDKQRFQLTPLTTTVSSTSLPPPAPSPSEAGQYLIRATQGHSLPIASAALLTPILTTDPDFPEEVVHGTFPNALKLILKSGGLSKMQRQHVHFTKALPLVSNAKSSASVPVVQASKSDPSGQAHVSASIEADHDPKSTEITLDEGKAEEEKVISGMRRDASVLIWVDVRRSILDGGLKWWRSTNRVILTEGDSHGMVSLDFIKRVEERGGGILWEPAKDPSLDKFPTLSTTKK